MRVFRQYKILKQSSLSDKKHPNILKLMKITLNTLKVHKNFLKSTTALHFPELLRKQKIVTTNSIYEEKNTACSINNFKSNISNDHSVLLIRRGRRERPLASSFSTGREQFMDD